MVYTKFYSVTAMLTELNLQKFDSLVENVEVIFNVRSTHACGNGIERHFVLFTPDVTDLCYV